MFCLIIIEDLLCDLLEYQNVLEECPYQITGALCR